MGDPVDFETEKKETILERLLKLTGKSVAIILRGGGSVIGKLLDFINGSAVVEEKDTHKRIGVPLEDIDRVDESK